MNSVIDWLLDGPAWVQYRARVDLLGQAEDDRDVESARQAMLKDPAIKALVSELAGWPGSVLTSHKSAGHPIHKLTFLADLGLRAEDPGMARVVKKVMAYRDEAGPFQVLMNIPRHFGGTGTDEWAWALCDAPLLVYALAKLGLGADRRVRVAAGYLAGLVRKNGWPCTVSPELGKFRGPGRKADPCPYANLVMLKALAELPEWRDHPAGHAAAEAALLLWTRSREEHPYMFFMGTDFRKLKAPLVWYDVLHVLDVLTRYPWLRKDKRLLDMAGVVESRADVQGRFTPESVWQAWKEWEFGQKKAPSYLVTLLARRVLHRLKLPGVV